MDINAFLEGSNLSEFALWSPAAGELLLMGSDDLAYYHQVEIHYHGVEYADAPASFWKPRFREATEQETHQFRMGEGAGTRAKLHVIEDSADGAVATYLVAVERCALAIGMVYHYNRPSLQPGERLAPWVRP